MKERTEKKILPKPLRELTLFDRFLFREAMDVPELFQILVDVIFEEHIEFLNRPQTEKELGVSPQLRSIRLDVFDMDVEKQIYNLEMQKENTYNLPKRSRFYQSQMDVGLLSVGCVDFNKLNNSYFVMVCGFDLFGEGFYKYSFQYMCTEKPELKLENGQHQIFINTKGKNRGDFSQEFIELMDYLNAPSGKEEAYIITEPVRRLHEGVMKLKRSETIGVKYMQEWEERIIEQEKAREEGKEEGIKAMILDNLEEGKNREQIIRKLEKRFLMKESDAETYYRRYVETLNN